MKIDNILKMYIESNSYGVIYFNNSKIMYLIILYIWNLFNNFY